MIRQRSDSSLHWEQQECTCKITEAQAEAEQASLAPFLALLHSFPPQLMELRSTARTSSKELMYLFRFLYSLHSRPHSSLATVSHPHKPQFGQHRAHCVVCVLHSHACQYAECAPGSSRFKPPAANTLRSRQLSAHADARGTDPGCCAEYGCGSI